MPTHVYANNNEVASKAADGKSIAAFPDVCFSPPAPPVGPMPLPYPNTGEVKDTDRGTAKVFIKDKMSGMGDESHMDKSTGDEPATQNFNKGLITGALQGKCYFGLWSMDVNMEGKGVPRHMDMVTHNHASRPGSAMGIEATMEAWMRKNFYVLKDNKIICVKDKYCFKILFCDDYYTPLDKINDIPNIFLTIYDDDNHYIFGDYLYLCNGKIQVHSSTRKISLIFSGNKIHKENVVMSIIRDNTQRDNTFSERDFDTVTRIDIRKLFNGYKISRPMERNDGMVHDHVVAPITYERFEVGTTIVMGIKKELCVENDGNFSTHLIICEACIRKLHFLTQKVSKFVPPNPLFLTATSIPANPLQALESVFQMSRSGYIPKLYSKTTTDNHLFISLSILNDKNYSNDENITFCARAYIYRDGIIIKDKPVQIDHTQDQLFDLDVTTVGTADFDFEQDEIEGEMYLQIDISQKGGNSYTGFVPGASTSIKLPIAYSVINRKILEQAEQCIEDMKTKPMVALPPLR